MNLFICFKISVTAFPRMTLFQYVVAVASCNPIISKVNLTLLFSQFIIPKVKVGCRKSKIYVLMAY